jgi:hypothetical protein
MDTVRAVPAMLARARELAGPVPVFLEPLAFRARRGPMVPPDPGDPADPRERQPMAAAWLLGCFAALTAPGGMTVLADGDGSPVATLLRELTSQPRGRLRSVLGDSRLAAACAIERAGERPLVLVASLRAQPITVRLDGKRRDLPGYGLISFTA